MSNIIMRPVYNRPEMLFLSIEYEIKAREYFKTTKKYFADAGDNYVTLFIIEHDSDPMVMNFVKNYPYESMYIQRPEKYGLTVNILEGFKAAFDRTDNHVVYIEDDILVHKTYFEYMDMLMKHPDVVGKYSVISPYNKNDNGNVNNVYKGHHYAALAPLIGKKFYESYIRPNSVMEYYKNPPKYVTELNEKYKEHWGKLYKYKNTMHWEQAGMINRLVDAAAIDEDMWVFMPEVNRQIHIGFYGKNRPGGKIPGKDFAERLTNLREIIKSGDEMYKYTAAKQYNDYLAFSPKLDTWDKILEIV